MTARPLALTPPGALAVTVVHDDFRLLAQGAVQQAAVRLGEKRIELVARKLELVSRKTGLEADLELAKAELKDAEKAVDDAQPTPGDAALARRQTAREGVAGLRRQATTVTARLSLVESLLTTIDSFVAAVRVVPTGGRRRPWLGGPRLGQPAGSSSWKSVS